MTDEELKRATRFMMAAMEETVGAVIDKKISPFEDKLDNYIVRDEEWKKQANPAVELGNNVRGFGKVFAYIVGTIVVIGGAIKVLSDFLIHKK